MRAVWLLILLIGVGCDEASDADCLGAGRFLRVDPDSNICVGSGTHFECEACADYPYSGPVCVIVDDDIYEDYVRCGSSCDALAEAACLDAPGCRATYVADQFNHCWQSAPRPKPGACGGLDATGCARRDDCVASYGPPTSGADFDHCADEPVVSFAP